MPKRLFRLEDVNAAREISQLTATADGSLVAMSVAEAAPGGSKTAVRIWLIDPGAPEGARPVTKGEKRAQSPAFSRDGRRLAYLAEGDKEKFQLAVLSAPFSEPRILTHFEHGVKSFEWLDARRLVVLAAPDNTDERKKAIERKDDSYVVDSDEPRSRMWLVNVDAGRPREIGPDDGHVALAAAAPDGKRLAYIHAQHSTLDCLWRGAELRVLDLGSGRSRLVRKLSSPHASGAQPLISPDGTRALFVDSPRKGGVYPYYAHAIGLDGKRCVRIDAPLGQVQMMPKWLDSDTVLAVAQRGVSKVLRAAPAKGGAGRDLAKLPGSVTDLSPAGGRVVFVYSECAKPPEVYEVDARAKSAPKKLTSLNRRLDVVTLAPAEVVRWKSREGWTVEGILHRPTTNARAPFATVVVPHGGPHGAVSDAWERPLAQVYAARGYASFHPNFRGGTGYGEKFLLAIRGDWGKGPADDIVRGIKLLQRRRVVDPRRIVVQGGSFGGFMTAWLIGHYDFFRAAAAGAPVVNNISMWGTTDIPVFQEWSLDASPLKDPDFYWRLSPIRYLTRCKTPTLVTVGDKDERVPPGQAQELYRTIKSAGAPAMLVRYPREPHGLAEPRHKLDQMKRIIDWFNQHLGKSSPDR